MQIYNGVTKDKRKKKDKEKDFNAKELLVSALPTFRTVNSLEEVRRGALRNQNGSGSCVTQALAKAIELSMKKNNFEDNDIERIISSLYFYQNRSNKPEAGSSPVEMCEFARKNGWYLEKDVPSQNMNDNYMDTFKIASNILKKQGYELSYFVDSTPEWDEIAQYVELYGNTMLLVDCDYTGYVKDIPTPNKRNHQIRHEICVADNITLNNVEYLPFDESWGIYGNSEIAQRGQRFMTKEAFYGMVEQAIVIKISKAKVIKDIDYSKYISIPSLKKGDKNKNVLLLQEMLIESGFLDKDTQRINYDSKGNAYGFYGTITANAVLKWQLKNVTSVSQNQLKIWKGDYFGKASLQTIKQLSGIAGDNPPAQTDMNIQFKWSKFLTITGSALLIYIATNLGNINWTKAGLASAGIALVQFVAQALVKGLSNND